MAIFEPEDGDEEFQVCLDLGDILDVSSFQRVNDSGATKPFTSRKRYMYDYYIQFDLARISDEHAPMNSAVASVFFRFSHRVKNTVVSVKHQAHQFTETVREIEVARQAYSDKPIKLEGPSMTLL